MMDDKELIPADTCRLCMENGKSMQPIFQADQVLLVKIMDVIQVEAHEEDGLPQQMCQQCAVQLDAAYVFKKQCQENYQKLRNILKKAKREDANSNSARSLERTSFVDYENNVRNVNAPEYRKELDKDYTAYDESDSDLDEMSVDVHMPVICHYDDGDVKTKTIQTHTCVICNMSFKLSAQLKKHFQSHVENKFKCLVCLEIFPSPTQLKDHFRTHVSEPVQCSQCDKVFLNMSCMKNHMRTHGPGDVDGLNVKKCEQCGKAFSTQANLTEHIRCHTGDRPFECERCGKAFTTQGNLKRHGRTHD